MLHPGHVQHFTTECLSNVLNQAGLEVTELAYHLDVRFSRYCRLGKSVIGLFENRVWPLKPALTLLKRLHHRYVCRPIAKNAGRIVARARIHG